MTMPVPDPNDALTVWYAKHNQNERYGPAGDSNGEIIDRALALYTAYQNSTDPVTRDTWASDLADPTLQAAAEEARKIPVGGLDPAPQPIPPSTFETPVAATPIAHPTPAPVPVAAPTAQHEEHASKLHSVFSALEGLLHLVESPEVVALLPAKYQQYAAAVAVVHHAVADS